MNRLPALPPSARVEIIGQSISYRRAGSGPALVLLHGFLCDSRCWRTQLADLSSAFTVVAWDAPGAGASSDPPAGFRLADWTDCLARFLDALDIERAHVLGLSWGGVLAQQFCASHPSAVASLVLADTYAGWKGSFGEEISAQRLARCDRDALLSGEDLARGWVSEMFTASASPDLLTELSTIFADFHPVGFRLMAKSLADTDTRQLFGQLRAPTLLLWGADDRRSPLSVANQLKQGIADVDLTVIPDAGHISNMERPELFNAQVLRFCLSRLQRR